MDNEIQQVETTNMVFGTTESSGILSKASEVATLLAPIIEDNKLYIEIRGKKYIYVDAWTSMMAMLGVFVYVEYSRRIDREGDNTCVYESRVLLKDTKGTVIGSGEALASRQEGQAWGNKEYSIKSMAQTRAVGKAARLNFSWIVNMAGYASCNAEEMITDIQSTQVEDKRNVTVVDEKGRPKPLWAHEVHGYITAGQAKMMDSVLKDCDMPKDIFIDICAKYKQEVDLEEDATTWFCKNVFQRIMLDTALASIKYWITKHGLTPTQVKEAWGLVGYAIDDVNLEFKSQYHFRHVLQALGDVKPKKKVKA